MFLSEGWSLLPLWNGRQGKANNTSGPESLRCGWDSETEVQPAVGTTDSGGKWNSKVSPIFHKTRKGWSFRCFFSFSTDRLGQRVARGPLPRSCTPPHTKLVTASLTSLHLTFREMLIFHMPWDWMTGLCQQSLKLSKHYAQNVCGLSSAQ